MDTKKEEEKNNLFEEKKEITTQEETPLKESENIISEKINFDLSSKNCNEAIEYVVNLFKKGVDYAPLQTGKKSTLLIPGADKFTFRFNLQAIFKKDSDTLGMVDKKNVIAYICELVDRKTGQVVGEGRGAAELGEKENCKTINGTIKMAEIRAKRDAVLNLFPIRDRFTQDMEDAAKEEAKALVIDSENGSVQIL